MNPPHNHAHAQDHGPVSELHRRPTRGGIRRFAIATGVAAVAGFVAMPTADAQTTTVPPLQAIMVTVNLNVATPSGVTGYRFDSICKNVPGTPTGDLNLSLGFGASGGTGLVLVPLSAAVSCATVISERKAIALHVL